VNCAVVPSLVNALTYRELVYGTVQLCYTVVVTHMTHRQQTGPPRPAMNPALSYIHTSGPWYTLYSSHNNRRTSDQKISNLLENSVL